MRTPRPPPLRAVCQALSGRLTHLTPAAIRGYNATMLRSHPADATQIQRVAVPTPRNNVLLNHFFAESRLLALGAVKNAARDELLFFTVIGGGKDVECFALRKLRDKRDARKQKNAAKLKSQVASLRTQVAELKSKIATQQQL